MLNWFVYVTLKVLTTDQTLGGDYLAILQTNWVVYKLSKPPSFSMAWLVVLVESDLSTKITATLG